MSNSKTPSPKTQKALSAPPTLPFFASPSSREKPVEKAVEKAGAKPTSNEPTDIANGDRGEKINTMHTVATSFMAKMGVDAFIDKLDTLLSGQIGLVRITGEISGFTIASSGHWYFNLKGEENMVKCVMFRRETHLCGMKPTQGLQVEVEAFVTLYRPRGELQLQVKALRPAGEGALYLAFMRLKEKLSAESLFDASRKKALPLHPKTIGIITSPSTAALADVARALSQYSPHIRAIVYPTVVQGKDAGSRIISALHQAIHHHQAEVLLFVRGGGSMEDLWCWNDEALIREVAKCPIPTISGVGHETDTTLIDFVVDARAPTPTAAARLLPVTKDLQAPLIALQNALIHQMSERLDRDWQRLDFSARLLLGLRRQFSMATIIPLQARLTRAMISLLQQEKQGLAQSTLTLTRFFHRRLKSEGERLSHLHSLLKAYDPTLPTQKGYALISFAPKDGPTKVITGIGDVAIGDKIHARFRDGGVYAIVTECAKNHAQKY